MGIRDKARDVVDRVRDSDTVIELGRKATTAKDAVTRQASRVGHAVCESKLAAKIGDTVGFLSWWATKPLRTLHQKYLEAREDYEEYLQEGED